MGEFEESLAFWEHIARELTWEHPWRELYTAAGHPGGRWFAEGRLSTAENCVTRHLTTRADSVAVAWEGEPGDQRLLTYADLAGEVRALASGLRALGVRPGDRVVLYLGLIPECVVAMLACAWVGAVHVVLSPALPTEAVTDRVTGTGARVLVTQDGAWRHEVVVPLKSRADEATAASGSVEHTIVVRRTGMDVPWFEGDRWYHDFLGQDAWHVSDLAPAVMSADHPLFVAYLSKTRGKPSGYVHETAGILAYALGLHRSGLAPGNEQVFWCTYDIGSIAAQTHGIYGPLLAGAQTLIFEGTLDVPTHRRTWELIERYQVTSLLTSPSVMRHLQAWTDAAPSGRQVQSLTHITLTGERIDDETLAWVSATTGPERVTVSDAWGQTELGAIVSMHAVLGPSLPEQGPRPGLDVVDASGRSLPVGEEGELILTTPWPARFQSIEGDDGSLRDAYWDRYLGAYATGDRAVRTPDGRFAVLGRFDAVVKVLGWAVSTTEVCQVVEDHPFVRWAEVLERPDERRGHHLVVCLALAPGAIPDERIAEEIRTHIHQTLGGIARPRTVMFLDEFPTRCSPRELREALRVLARDRHEPVIVLGARDIQETLAQLA